MARTSTADKPLKPESESHVAVEGARGPTEPDQTSQITVYPRRSYLDGKDMRRAGEPYLASKHEAAVLIAKGLATDEKPKA